MTPGIACTSLRCDCLSSGCTSCKRHCKQRRDQTSDNHSRGVDLSQLPGSMQQTRARQVKQRARPYEYKSILGVMLRVRLRGLCNRKTFLHPALDNVDHTLDAFMSGIPPIFKGNGFIHPCVKNCKASVSCRS